MSVSSAPSTSTGSPPDPDAGALRLLVLNYEYPPLGGGAAPVTYEICRELAARGHRVDVVTMAYRGLPREESHGTLRVFRIPSWRSRRHLCRSHELASWVISAMFFLPTLLRRERYDLVHAHFFFPCGVVAGWLRRRYGLPYVVTAHGSDVPGYNPDRFRLLHRMLLPVWRRVVRATSLVISPSAWLGGLIAESLGESFPLEVVPNGIHRDWAVPPVPRDGSILAVSRLFDRKGIQHLLRALQRGPLGRDIHIVGDGPHREELEALAADVPDRVVFHGWVEPGAPELRALYRSSSIFVFPSIAENFPISLLEAMISGMAIVSSDLDSCREVLGETAEYFPPADVDALREVLERLVADPATRESRGERARQRVLDHFTWDRVGARYETLLAAHRRGR